MIKAMTTGPDGKGLFIIGLSFGNLDKFRAEPGDTYIRISGEEVGLPVDIMIISGETEAHIAESLPLGPDTEVRISNRLKS
jgi:hypothetical protein